MSIQVGQKAPDFKLQALVNGEFHHVSLSDYSGRWVVLFFYPLDFTFVCPTEITEFAEQKANLRSMAQRFSVARRTASTPTWPGPRAIPSRN